MSDYEDNSASDSELEDEFPTTRKLKKPLKKRKEEPDEDEEEEDVSVHSDEDDDDENEAEESDIESDAEIDEMELGETGVARQGSIQSSFMNMDDDEEDEDADYLQRFDEGTKQDIVSNYHPELQTHNYNEVLALSRLVKDETGKIVDPLHKTLPFLTKYERARILGERAKQLNAGAEPFISLEPEIIDGYIIAQKELEQKKIPFIVKRPLPDGGCEYWRLKDLEIL